MKKMLWISRHKLTEAQKKTVEELMKDKVEVVYKDLVFPATDISKSLGILKESIKEVKPNVIGFVSPQHLTVIFSEALTTLPKVYFINSPSARQKGVFVCEGLYYIGPYTNHGFVECPIPIEKQEESQLIPERK